ncbi:hypothetical protein MNBD_BACTEROID01-1866 [hydrothermal vent metagenome]|uniref:DUF559 domain-containing protein n=1 Tax=hydrothermal vent metagenome TaxID=652676 RepID=A0A3B0U474_9ZZZZ
MVRVPLGEGGFRGIGLRKKYTTMPNKTYYNRNLKEYARKLRKEGTKGEAILWKHLLRAKQTGWQFNRQFPIGNYIVDFICRKLKLIIEIDGSSHLTKGEEDFERQNYLGDLGYRVLRFSESEVIYRMDDVAADIQHAIHCLSGDE